MLKNQQKPIQEVLSLNRNEIKMFNFYNKFEKYSKKFKSLGFNYGQKNGFERWYYPSGKLKTQIMFEYDKKESEVITWTESGKIIN